MTTMANFAGQLGRLWTVNAPFTITRCLTQPNARNLSGLCRAGVGPSCLHNAATRTKTCQTHSQSHLLSTRSNTNSSQPFRFCHTTRNMHSKGPAPTLLSASELRYSRTVHRNGFLAFFGMKTASLQCRRLISSGQRDAWKRRNRSGMLYATAMVILVVGFSYAAVPLYAVFCQATGLGGQITQGHNIDLVEDMVPVRGRPISIRFNADTAASMQWNFRPQQLEIKVVPGETALAFYSALNPMDKPITGISTYNVVPFEAGQYFNKIQCFCFEEQRLNPHEQVDMPVFFYIDPEFAEDPKMAKVDTITLSYTFFEAKEGLVLPDPFTKPDEVAT